MKHEFSRQIFEKYWFKKFNENPTSGVGVHWDWYDEAKATFLNFVKFPKNITTQKTNRPLLAVAEGKGVVHKFLIPKLHAYKNETLIILGRTIKDKNFVPHFRNSFRTFTKKHFDEFIVICCWRLKVAHKQRNISTAKWYKENIANVVSNSDKK